jgi:broad specificity phosphatase PhoE
METAALLDLPGAEWRLDQRLRERDWGEIMSMPRDEHQSIYPLNAFVKKIDALYWRPPAGESIADVRLRLRSIFDTLHRECSDQRVIMVSHGEFISAARAAVEYMSDEEWVSRDGDAAWKIHNTHVYHYSRRDPETGEIGKYLGWRRSHCPWKEDTDSGWVKISRKRFTNDGLLEQVNQIRPLLDGSNSTLAETENAATEPVTAD